ncbi:MAG TPA: M48 family metallopeptidase [Terriglobales bacterium]|jgi:predicted Zn-dependent protease|nr:M48 family metallopeptidase [Terriglobales bacterium]
MRSAYRFLSVGSLALMLVPLGMAQNQSASSPSDQNTPSTSQGQSTQNASSTSQSSASDNPGQYMPDKPEKNAPPKNTMDNIDAIGNRNVGCNKGMGNWYSLDKQVAMGKQYSQQVEHGAKMVNDPTITEYVNRIGQNLVRNSDAKVPFTIKVIDTDEINAFALPGGFFYVNSGLILAADNEAELAGVMAHEIGHVAACHVAREQTRSNIVNLASIPLIFVPGGWGVYEASQAALGFGVPLTFMKFSRTFESEADFLGMEYMYKAGYDPQSFISFFEKIEAQEKKKPGTLAKAFSSHPMTPDRVDAAQKELKTVLPARPEYIVDTSEFDQVKARLASLENRHKLQNDKDKADRPTLRRATADNPSPDNNSNGSSSGSSQPTDDRPTLKRNDGSGSQSFN